MILFMSSQVHDATSCPNCHTPLEPQYQIYVIALKEASEDWFLQIGCEAGSFCPDCPTVVLDVDEIEDAIAYKSESPVLKYAVMGMVDLDEIPEDKEDIPLGDDDNPITLIEFEHSTRSRQPIGRSNPPISFPAQSHQPKIGRNDPCPCGSGKKYKRCCGK